MRPSRSLATLLGAGLLSLALSSAAYGAKPVSVHCGQTITSDTKLANDLIDCPGDGIVIGANDITLDLNGHTVDGDGAFDGDDFGVDNTAGHDGVTIRGGSIQEFVEGVLIEGATKNRVRDLRTSHQSHGGITVVESADTEVAASRSVADGVGVIVGGSQAIRLERNSASDSQFSGVLIGGSERVHVTGNSIVRAGFAGMPVVESDHNRIERNSVSESSEGIFLEGESDHNVVSENSASRNGEGMVLDPGTHHNLVAKNSFRGNRFNGVVLVGSNDNVITQNSVVGNGDGSGQGGRGSDAGIHLFAVPDEPELTTDRNVISRNRLAGNAPDGILVDPDLSGNVLDANRSTANADDGIDVDSAATTLTKNTANDNDDLGIEAIPGVTDGGGNKARGNGNPLQCTNVFCK